MALAQIRDRSNFTFYHLDITDREGLGRLFEHRGVQAQGQVGEKSIHLAPLPPSSPAPFDAVVHLAARAGVRQSVENPWVYYDTNVVGTLNLLELCKAYGVKKFVLASTSSLYGGRNPIPFREDADTDSPLSPYAASKKAAEALAYTYHHLCGIDVTVLR